jgi:hypothetical protein
VGSGVPIAIGKRVENKIRINGKKVYRPGSDYNRCCIGLRCSLGMLNK